MSEALSRVGREVGHFPAAAGAPVVVVIRDRHSAAPGFHPVRPQIEAVQHDNRLLVEFLVERGFDLLGCECAAGPVRENKDSGRQFRIVNSRIKAGVELDGWSVFQPIRYQLLWPTRLSVWGVEDAELYEQDIVEFKTFVRASRHARRNDLDEKEKRQALETARAASMQLRRNIDERGLRAAGNLLLAMKQTGSEKSILMIGGAHVPSAIAALKEAGITIHVFESASYRKLQD